MQRRSAQDGKVAGASPATRTNFKLLVGPSPQCFFDCENEEEDEDEVSWNVNRLSGPGLGANECVPSGMWCEPTAFRHFQ